MMTNLHQSFYPTIHFSGYFLSLGLLLTVPSYAANDNVGTLHQSSTVITPQEKVVQVAALIDSAMAREDDDEEDDEGGNVLPPVNHSMYAKECGSCHFAYQPGLLPARSWEKVMTTLKDHFDDNAELEATVQKTLTDYLVKNAAETARSELSTKILRSLPAKQAPRRILEVPYMAKEHRKLSKNMVSGNPEVKSLSNCEHCHTRAGQGSYSEEEIKIPGYGRWD
jgi:hypothetical protein